LRRAKRATDTSNVDTNDEEEDKRRDARKPSRYSSSEDGK